jgi:uncharacterized membrane protein YfcA
MVELPLLLMYAAAFITSVISGTIGALGGVILLAMMTIALPYRVVIPIHGLVQLASNSSRVFFLRRAVDRRILAFFALGLPLGSLVAYRLLILFPSPEWCLLFVVFLLLYVALKPARMPDIALPPWGYFILGIFTGIIGPLVGAVGPLIVSFFVRRDLPKETIVATQAACQMLVHLAKIPVFMALAFPYQEYLLLLAGMIVAVVVGSKVGILVLRSLKAEHFMLLLRGSMLLVACRLVYGLVIKL